MATIYVSSVIGNSDANSGATWTLAKATVTGALVIATDATNIIYLDSAHTNTAGAAVTWNASTSGSHVAIISVNRNGSTTTGHSGHLAGAIVSVGAFNGAFNIGSSGDQRLFVKGVTLNGGTGSVASGHIAIASAGVSSTFVSIEFESCTLNVNSTNAAARLLIGVAADASKVTPAITFRNCVYGIRSGATAAAIEVRDSKLRISGLTLTYTGANKPASLFEFTASVTHDVEILDSDLSGYEKSGGFYFDVTDLAGNVLLMNCKRSGTPGFYTGTWRSNNAQITAILTDSADTSNTFEYYNRLGTLVEDTANYRTNGAQFAGSGLSWQIVTTSLCSEAEPFVTPWIQRWTTTTGSQAIGLQLLRANATDFTDRQCWAEFECQENASFPNGTLTSSRNAAPFDGTGADLTDSAEAWIETVANENPLVITVTRTIAEKSMARARLWIAVASETFNLDPCLTIGSQGANPAVRWVHDGAVNAEPASAGGASGRRSMRGRFIN